MAKQIHLQEKPYRELLPANLFPKIPASMYLNASIIAGLKKIYDRNVKEDNLADAIDICPCDTCTK